MKSSALLFCFGTMLFWSCSRQDKKKQTVTNDKQKDTILLVTMDFKDQDILPPVQKKISSFYNLPVKTISMPLPQQAYLKERDRYSGNRIIDELKVIGGGKYCFVAGLTSKDICTKKDNIPDWGIFGLGSLDNGGCITSTFRMKKGVSQDKLIERTQKVILHEIGHNHGLNHCLSADPCFMKDAMGKISTVDNEPMDLCKSCRASIKR